MLVRDDPFAEFRKFIRRVEVDPPEDFFADLGTIHLFRDVEFMITMGALTAFIVILLITR